MSESREEAYITALTTEHFALQSSSAATITEANSRSSTYLLCVSSSLVALGFTSSNDQVFPFMVATVLPVLFILGWFTIVRLVDTTIENLGFQTRIKRIYQFYASLAPAGDHNFPVGRSVANEAQTRYRILHRFPFLSTMASMIGAVNAVVAGAGVAFGVGVLVNVTALLAIGVGALVAAGLFCAVVAYQRRRFRAAAAYPVDDE